MRSSVHKHRFSQVPTVKGPRSTFDRSFEHKTTFDAGLLIPIFYEFMAYPGDTIALDMTGVGWLSTPTFPILDNLYAETFFFGIPHRQIWENFQKFCGERVDPADSIDYTFPQVTLNNVQNETLYDYLGIPTRIAADLAVNNAAGRAANSCWNHWFRDQNLQDTVVVDVDNGPDDPADYVLLRRGKRHDYFTASLPWLQRGDPVELPLGNKAAIYGDGMAFSGSSASGNYVQIRDSQGSSANLRTLYATGGGPVYGGNAATGTSEMMVDLTSATASSINQLREAEQVQRLLERDARSGTRYREIVASHFHVESDDLRMFIPEYLGGGRERVKIRPVARTDSSPGQLGATGRIEFSGHGFTKSFHEHTLVLGFVCIRCDQKYQQGLHRHWSVQTRYDLYWPDLAHLGEMAVLNKEIYNDATTIGSGANEDVWGYQEAWAHERYKPSYITGKFRSNDPASLDAWHLATEFATPPALDDSFIQENPPLDRCIATPSEPHFIFDSYFRYIHTRPMPVFSIPGLGGRF